MAAKDPARRREINRAYQERHRHDPAYRERHRALTRSWWARKVEADPTYPARQNARRNPARRLRYRTDLVYYQREIERSRRQNERRKKVTKGEREWRAKLAQQSLETLTAAGWTIKELVPEVGVCRRALGNWKLGKAAPNANKTREVLRLRELALAVEQQG